MGAGGEGAGPGRQSGEGAEHPSGVSVVGNIRTLACMKDRSGNPAITLEASALKFSSLLGFLVEVLVFSTVDIRRAKASAMRLLVLLASILAVVSS